MNTRVITVGGPTPLDPQSFYQQMEQALQDNCGITTPLSQLLQEKENFMFPLIDNLKQNNNTILLLTSYYVFYPQMILALIVIWLLVGFSYINWAVGLFLSLLFIVSLYTASMAYRAQGMSDINNNLDQTLTPVVPPLVLNEVVEEAPPERRRRRRKQR